MADKDRIKEVASIIEERVRVMGIKQDELASKLGVSQPTVSQILNGNRTITHRNAEKLRDILGIPYDFLRYGVGEYNEINITREGNTNLRDHAQLAGHDITNHGKGENDNALLKVIEAQLEIIKQQQAHNERLITLFEQAMNTNTTL